MTAPLRFDDYQRRCLYDPVHGYYSRRGRAGRRGADFITSPEVGSLFGAVLARAVDTRWRAIGCPSRFDLVEVGAGRGALMRAVLDAAPECLEALAPMCVEQSAVLRDLAVELLAGRAVVVDRMPPTPVAGIIIANELLDNFVIRIIERTDRGWAEVWVDAGSEELRPTDLSPPFEGDIEGDIEGGVAFDVEVGTRFPIQVEAAAWVQTSLDLLSAGSLLVIDYGVAATSELTDRRWLRTYAEHRRGTDPYESPGNVDITCDVAFDQLPGNPELSSQAGFLTSAGIEELVSAARSTWHERSHLGDLTALQARSRVGEAEALCDPAGLGAFVVAEWIRP